MQLLELDTTERAGWTVVTARGQLDVATAPQLRQTLVEAQYGGATKVVVDLEEVEFLDSMGLGVLVGAIKRARAHDGELVLACVHARLRHVLELSRVAEIVRVVDGVADVVAADAGTGGNEATTDQ